VTISRPVPLLPISYPFETTLCINLLPLEVDTFVYEDRNGDECCK